MKRDAKPVDILATIAAISDVDVARAKWSEALAAARAGDPALLAELVGYLKPESFTKRAWSDFVAFIADPVPCKRGPGKSKRASRQQAMLIRDIHAVNKHGGMTDDASFAKLSQWFPFGTDTIRNIVKFRGAYQRRGVGTKAPQMYQPKGS